MDKETKEMFDSVKSVKIKIPCLECGKEYYFDIESNEACGVFNVFCPNKDCEDRYSFKQ